ncbi:AfsR/SARP family transcriptional regulator [Nocardia arthritidis]|uniref:OmpR/PhoB-type domain-containing protein n=1 Tax=Nocardia arthritidis TaxID=228602 RepID=A0A6G9YR19_9NOCA|nr:AfsR/SARP family transcriptional regulator [Nocardia arthritidis]QIS15560.1 hypothetical protein F5544_38695 [Nocardia arthritidis]
MLDISLLGNLSVRIDGRSIVPSAAKPRVILALLAANVDSVVSVESITNEIWGNAAPRSARTVIQNYIMALRKLASPTNGATVKEYLRTHSGGYMLAAESASVDMYRFDRASSAGHRAREMGDLEQASQHFADALAVWRGRPLADIRVGNTLGMLAGRLEEARLNVLDRKAEVDLRLGRHHEVLGDLTSLAGQYPTHEGFCAHLMLALYRSGRRPEALHVYRRLRTRMVEDQALEPSPTLRRLHSSMLSGDRTTVSSGIPSDLAARPWTLHAESEV